MSVILLLVRLALAGVFVVAGLTKLADLPGSRRAMRDFGLPAGLAETVGLLLPLAEFVVAVALLPVRSAWYGALAALVLLLAFVAGIALNMARGRAPDCHCFGQLHSEPVGWTTLVRNGGLAGLAAVVAFQGRSHQGADAFSWVGRLTTFEAVALAVAVAGFALLALQGWVIFHLMRQQGRMLVRLDALQGAPDPVAPPTLQYGLPVGTPAPHFALPTLDGEVLSLDALLTRNKPVGLLFTDPHCGPCNALLPDIGTWQREYADRLTLIPVSRGSVEENRAKAGEHGIDPVLLQEDREVAAEYEVNGTPSMVLIRPDGTIAGPAAPGEDAIRVLVAGTLRPSPLIPLLPELLPPSANGGNGHAAPVRVMRRGDPAPSLRLPDLDGRLVDLADQRGRVAVVLFWNPGCGFCRSMLPDLRAWEANRREGAPDLLVVSTGTVETNQAQGISSPVLLDGGFGAGASFGAQGTPMAVLVDAEGRIASEIVAGGPAVLELLKRRSGTLTS